MLIESKEKAAVDIDAMFSPNKKNSNLKKTILTQNEFGTYQFDSIIVETEPAGTVAPAKPKEEERNLEEIVDDGQQQQAEPASNSAKPKTFMELM